MSTTIVRRAEEADLAALPALIAALNVLPEQRCLHCGETPEVIAAALAALGAGTPYRPAQLFVVAEQDGQIVGTLGYDINAELSRGWLWGPFVAENIPWQPTAEGLLAALRAQLPASMGQLDDFLDVRNQRSIELLRADGFVQGQSSHIYLARRDDWLPVAASYGQIAPAQYAAFRALHAATFPSTYYSGDEILELLDEQHQLFVAAEGEALLGYLSIGVEEDPDEAYVHFVGVRPESRGQGIGKRLLNSALHWAFAERGLAQAALTVEDARNIARGLYEGVGFRLRYSGINMRWKKDQA